MYSQLAFITKQTHSRVLITPHGFILLYIICILILYNTGLIKSEKPSLTLHSRVMASAGTPLEIWLEIVAAINCLHHSTWDPGLCEKKKKLTQASASVNASAISWYNVKLQAFINVQCWHPVACRLKMTDGNMRSEKCVTHSDLSLVKNATTLHPALKKWLYVLLFQLMYHFLVTHRLLTLP